jgi:enoyl-CoA hydratase/carnithine racemase
MEEMSVDNDVRVLIFRGAGDHFCMGGDLEEIVENQGIETSRFFHGLGRMYKAIKYCRKITIAAVHGTCTAGGLGVALSCDMIVASEDAKFGATAIKVGMFCASTAVILPPIIGDKKACELQFTGRVIPASEAERYGFVNRVVPREKLMDAALDLAGEMLVNSPMGLEVGKRSYLMTRNMPHGPAIDYAVERIAYLADLKDGKEAIRAFLEGREPVWGDEWRRRGGGLSLTR